MRLPYEKKRINAIEGSILLGEHPKERIQKRNAPTPNDIFTHRSLIVTYSWAGRLEEARAEAKEVLRINPKYSVSRRPGLFKNPADWELIKDAFHKAGLPDCPPCRGSKKAGLK